MKNQKKYKKCSLAIIVIDKDKFLLQLRDDKQNIKDPNLWGLFGGSIKKNEKPIKALTREVEEEINIKVYKIKKFCKIFYKKDMMECYIYIININKPRIKLNEGQDFGYFSFEKIISNKVFSKKTKNYHQVTHTTLKAINKYYNIYYSKK